MSLRQAHALLQIETAGRGFLDITGRIGLWVGRQGVAAGLLTLFLQHTSASLLIQENADPDVLADLEDFFGRLVPENPGRYRHAAEGPDDMPAHIRAALTATHLAIPVVGGRAALGTWQSVYLFEHRMQPQRRNLALHLIGE